MNVKGVIHINHIELDKNHKVTLKMLNKLGFLGNWVNTSNCPEVQVFKNDPDDPNYITVVIYPDLLDIYASFKSVRLNSEEGSELRAGFDHAVALIDKIYHKNSMNLDSTDDYEIIPDKSV